MNKQFAKLLCILPVKLQHKVMTNITVNNYKVNDYNENYRRWDSKLDDSQVKIISEYLNSIGCNCNILDLGCGNGERYDRFISNKGFNITGVDISERQIKHAKSILPEHEFVICDFMKYKPEKKFDGITAFYSLYNIPRRMHRRLLKKCYNWLNPSGRMLVLIRIESVGSADYWEDWCGAPLIFSYYSSKKFKEIARSVGFYVTQFQYTHHTEYIWLILSKNPDLPATI